MCEKDQQVERIYFFSAFEYNNISVGCDGKRKGVHEDKRDTKGNMQEHSGASCLSVLLY